MNQEENEVKENPYLITNEFGIHVFSKDTGKYTVKIQRNKCNKTNCGYNQLGCCELENPNRNFDNCNDFYTVE